MKLTHFLFIFFALLFPSAGTCANGQLPAPREIVQQVVQEQIGEIRRSDVSLRYQMKKSDRHGTVVRDVIDTPRGTVARLILHEDKPLTAEEDKAEHTRLEEFIKSHSEIERKRKTEEKNRDVSEKLISAMPRAMIYSYRVGATVLSNPLAIDYRPDPSFHPASIEEKALEGLSGTIWVDGKDHHFLRMEGNITQPLNFAWGIVAKVFPGGYLELQEQAYAPGRYAYSRLVMKLSVRELMLRTQKIDTSMESSHFQTLPGNLTLEQAVKILLDTPSISMPR